jgi:hypothetical protein
MNRVILVAAVFLQSSMVVVAGETPHFTITGSKAENRVVVAGAGLTVTLPFADDYAVGDCTADRPLMVLSKSLKVAASITVDAEPDSRQPLEYLHGQLEALKAKMQVVKPAFVKPASTPLLVYWVPIEDAVQFNLWAVRPGPAQQMYRLHVSQVVATPPEAKPFVTALMSLVDQGFLVRE